MVLLIVRTQLGYLTSVAGRIGGGKEAGFQGRAGSGGGRAGGHTVD